MTKSLEHNDQKQQQTVIRITDTIAKVRARPSTVVVDISTVVNHTVLTSSRQDNLVGGISTMLTTIGQADGIYAILQHYILTSSAQLAKAS